MHKWKLALTDAAVLLSLIALGIAGRLLWHPAQVAPIAAAALFAGFFLRSRLLALSVPLIGMAVSDYIIGYYDFRIMAAVYLGLCLPVLLAGFLRREVTIPRLVGCSLVSSVAFFLLSNGAEWAFGSLYVADAEGLQRCFTMALPFFRNTLIGDLVWTSVLFAAHGLILSQMQLAPPRFEAFDTPAPVKVRK